jgi:hypothetical protein
MSKLSICVGLFFASPLAFADTYVCLPDAAAVIQDDQNGMATASVVDIPWAKFIQSNEGGDWSVKMSGQNALVLENCASEYLCEHSFAWGGVFMRNPKDGTFEAIWMDSEKGSGKHRLFSARGRCTKF